MYLVFAEDTIVGCDGKFGIISLGSNFQESFLGIIILL